MVATLQTDRRLYKRQVKADNDLVYYEYRLDTCGNGALNGLESESAIGVMTKKNALRLQKLMNEVRWSNAKITQR
jgi:hypothetical protein